MKKYLPALFYSFLFNIVLIELINTTKDMRMTFIVVIIDALVCSLIGVSTAATIRYSVKAAKEHEA